MQKDQIAEVAGLSKREHMSTRAFKNYLDWRELLANRVRRQGELPFMERPDQARELLAINRQVALAIIADLEYNFRKRKHEIQELTGKSAVYWNFQILGTTIISDDESRKFRQEQKTTDYFMATTVNHLHAHGVELNWKRLGFYLEQARWRVIAEPADKAKREVWTQQCGGECVEPGINYPAPWHVANWAGEQVDGMEDMLILDYSDYKQSTKNPGRIKRLDIACYGPDGNPAPLITGEGKFTARPSILNGLGKRDIKREDAVGADLERMLSKTMRKMGLMERQERERRMMAEDKVREMEAQVIHLEYELAKRDHEEEELKKLRKENREMKKWGAEMRKRLEQINTLSWLQDVARKLPKD